MILCGGDALIDFVPVPAPDGGVAFQPRIGGAVLNTATALRRMGEEVSFIGALSDDLFGDMLAAHMAREGIATRYVSRTAHDSTLAFVTLEEGEARYAFYDRTSAGRLWSDTAEVPRSASALHIGSVTLIADPSAEAYARLAEKMSPTMLVSLDPNCRPGLISDREAYKARIERIAAVSHLVRFSDEDFAYLYPDASEEHVAADLLAGQTGIVLISRGAEGASAYWNGGRIDVPARKVVLADSIGAGDTFHAGVLAALATAGKLSPEGLPAMDRSSLEHALEFATVAAALNCGMAGCNPPGRSEIDAALRAK